MNAPERALAASPVRHPARHGQTRIPCVMMRGGTSKGAFFLAADLPADAATRDAVLLAVMGSPDARQIDGIGGADPLTSKVAIVSPSSRADADVDYLFAQVVVDAARVDYGQNCGNMLAGVGPFAIERGLVPLSGDHTTVSIHMVNTGQIAVATVDTRDGIVQYDGDAGIDGVPGAAAPIPLEFKDTAGSTCGSLFPTGARQDVVEGVTVTCIDNGMPLVLIRAADMGITGYEDRATLDADSVLKAKVEAIRLAVGPRMNLGDVGARTVPKMCLIAAPRTAAGCLSTRSFIPHRCHASIGVLGAVSVATAAALPGTVCDGIASINDVRDLADGLQSKRVSVEHPTGEFTLALTTKRSGDVADAGNEDVVSAALLRTARWLFEGYVCIPSRVWQGA